MVEVSKRVKNNNVVAVKESFRGPRCHLIEVEIFGLDGNFSPASSQITLIHVDSVPTSTEGCMTSHKSN